MSEIFPEAGLNCRNHFAAGAQCSGQTQATRLDNVEFDNARACQPEKPPLSCFRFSLSYHGSEPDSVRSRFKLDQAVTVCGEQLTPRSFISLPEAIDCVCSISRCAFLNAPVGYFPKTSTS